MKLTLIPQRNLPDRPETTTYVAGDVLTVDGEAYDLSVVPEGGIAIPEGFPFVGNIARTNGVIEATLIVQYDDTVISCEGAPWVIENAEGDVFAPFIRRPVEEPTDEV